MLECSLKFLVVPMECRLEDLVYVETLMDAGSRSAIRIGPSLRTGVCTENSNSNIMVMQSTKDRVAMDTSSSLNWARERRVLI
jgi:hypothetical protein